MKRILKNLLIAVFVFSGFSIVAQESQKKADSGYKFTMIKQLPATSVKNQNRSGTCWSYSAISFLESELLRMKKDTFDLSEMYCVRCCYTDKASTYVRFHGGHSFGPGGAAHDVTYVLKNWGMVPNEMYNGLASGDSKPVHGEMDGALKAYVEAIVKNPNKQLTPVWLNGFNGILDAYMGRVPEKFFYKGTDYTPKSFRDMLGLNPDDYVELTSYTHHPFYSKFILEVEDNWLMDEVYNLPLDELMQVIENSVMNGYTVVWGSDVSEKGFSWKTGVAVVPEKVTQESSGLDRAKWDKLSESDREKLSFKFEKPGPEKRITQEMRQQEFDNYLTTDDHGMHITGIAKDQNDNKYFYVKNSWGLEGSPYSGYFYASDAFVRLKTMDIMVNVNAIPKEIRKKLGL
jgi:bleomycin hydrolase